MSAWLGAATQPHREAMGVLKQECLDSSWVSRDTCNCFAVLFVSGKVLIVLTKHGNNSHRKSFPLKDIQVQDLEVHNVYYRNNLKIIARSLHKIKCADSIFLQCGM